MLYHLKRKFIKHSRSTEAADITTSPLSDELTHNIEVIEELYSASINKDFVVRDIHIKGMDSRAALFFYATAVDLDKVEQSIISPLLTEEGKDIRDIVSVEHISDVNDLLDVSEYIHQGYVIFLKEGSSNGLAFNVASYEHRGIEKAENEVLVKGPKEAFTESASVNLSLLRKRISNPHFIAEGMSVGVRSKSEATILYMNDLVDENVLTEVKERIKRIEVDSVRSIEMLEQFIEERTYSLLPSVLYTERPDRTAAYIDDGYIAIIMENSPAALILPVTFWSFFHSPEDHYSRLLYGNFSRLIRLLAVFITLFISSFYIAVTNFHEEMIPIDLLLAIAGAREQLPFPLVFEIVMMEFAFELIREAGLRIPSPLGPTIGIVGALILGQAAVEANVISPIVVIVVALSGLSSFAIADVSLNYTIRMNRFVFIFAAATYGIFGIIGASILCLMYAAAARSFGVPFLSPLSPHFRSSNDTVFRGPVTKEIFRPGQIHPRDMKKNSMR
ncbi:spore germination protein [Alkalihalophilus marmarensis]|uniref:spore germination protein n=1 Tax=Alkalihalophilus marmarensis TaxID=521377 RepID=UPI002DB9427F|nr:spore germination protein [Alkalihalophilus marmarensis]MEC2073246.1 spore germination protein [Alkalihalophilus marmarensis]